MSRRRDPARGRLVRAAALVATAAVVGCSPAGPPAPPAAPPAVAGAPDDAVPAESSGVTLDTDGAVLEETAVTGTVTVAARDVRIRRVRVTCSPGDHFAITVEPGASATIEDSELTGDCAAAALHGQDFVARRVDIHGVPADGVKLDGGGVLIEDSTVRDFTPSAGAHADGVQASVPIGDVTIRDTLVDPGPAANGAIFLVPELQNGSRPGPVLLQGNTFGGGGDTVHIGASSAGGIDEVRVVDNVWRRNALFGPVYRTGDRPAEWTDNRYEDGTPIPPP